MLKTTTRMFVAILMTVSVAAPCAAVADSAVPTNTKPMAGHKQSLAVDSDAQLARPKVLNP